MSGGCRCGHIAQAHHDGQGRCNAEVERLGYCNEWTDCVCNAFDPGYTCPHCRRVSFYRADALHRYCANCRRFEDDPRGGPEEST